MTAILFMGPLINVLPQHFYTRRLPVDFRHVDANLIKYSFAGILVKCTSFLL